MPLLEALAWAAAAVGAIGVYCQAPRVLSTPGKDIKAAPIAAMKMGYELVSFGFSELCGCELASGRALRSARSTG